MKKFLFASLFALSLSSCAISQHSYTPVESYRYEYRYEYCYNGHYRPVIYVNDIALYYYLGDWYCIPSHHYHYICPVNRPRYFYTRKSVNHHKPKPKSIPHKPIKPERPSNKEGLVPNDRYEHKREPSRRPTPSRNNNRSSGRPVSNKRVKR
jgi:hypothetical protein